MESETETTPILATTKTTTTTWTPIHGYLDAAVTVESSLSPENESASVVRKPLVLRRPDSTESPCEITIHFNQQHEIRQIYVKSTARVYEIYYTTKSNRSNEYLCTVRCGIAAKVETLDVSKDYEVLQATDVEGSVKPSHNADDRRLSATESRTSSGSSTFDDGWVEVKNPCSWTHNGDGSPPSQDFYEATAEISDADPCVSLTVRLLSIQNRESVCIDEIYIFVDPVEPVDADRSPSSSGNSAGNALMSLLVPTLLQLSRSQTSNLRDGSCLPNAPERMARDGSAQLIGSAVGSGDVQKCSVPNSSDEPKETEEKENDNSTADTTLVVDSNQYMEIEKNPDGSSGTDSISRSHLEKTMDELFSRLSKIEDLCLRFEKNMLKPLINMEARLERVEQTLESFMKDSRTSVATSCIRISAPDFSCSGSELSSSFTYGSNGTSAPPDLSENHDSPKEESLAQHHGVHISVNTSNLLPGLVVTAPDFFSIDDDEEKDTDDATQEPQKANLGKPLSIDDALASALAGFLSSTSTSTPVSAQVPEVEPVESLIDDGQASGEKMTFPKDFCREPSVLSIKHNVGNITAGMKSLVLTSDKESDETDDLGSGITDVPDNSEETEEIVYGVDANLTEELNCTTIESDFEKACKAAEDANSTGDEAEAGESGNKMSQNFISNYSDIQSNIVSDAASEATAFDVNVSSSTREVREEVADLWSILPRSPSCTLVDFDAPILDVEFLRQDHPASLAAVFPELCEPDVIPVYGVEFDGEMWECPEENLGTLLYISGGELGNSAVCIDQDATLSLL
ncbi:hypothetical protein Drorol1_Dr00016002 [Drosera rotundifolia]